MIPSVVEQHAREAAFQWRLRDRAGVGPLHTVRDLAALDARLDAHLDGLRVACRDGGDPQTPGAAAHGVWEVCASVLPLKDPGEVFVVAALGLETGAYERVAAVLDAAGLDAVRARGIVSALGWTHPERVRAPLEAFLAPGGPPALLRMGLAGAVLHGIDPGAALEHALASTEPELRARALRAAGELGRVDLLGVLRREVSSEDPRVRFWAAWSSALLGEGSAIDPLVRFCEGSGRHAALAVDLAARVAGRANGAAVLDYVAMREGGARLALLGATALGDAASLGRLIAGLRVPELARLAAEGIGAVTGIDTRAPSLAGSAPEGFASDEDPDPDDALPWPCVEALERVAGSVTLSAGVRYLAGEPISAAVVERVLAHGTQRRRLGAALERCILQPGSPLALVRGPGFRQRSATS